MRSFELGSDGAVRPISTPQSELSSATPIDVERPLLHYISQQRQERMQLFQRFLCIERPELLLKPDNQNKEIKL